MRTVNQNKTADKTLFYLFPIETDRSLGIVCRVKLLPLHRKSPDKGLRTSDTSFHQHFTMGILVYFLPKGSIRTNDILSQLTTCFYHS